jgi:tight adherence protein C
MDAWMIAAISFVVVGGATFGVAYLLLWRWPVVTRERLEGHGSALRDSTILRFEPELASRWQRIAARVGRALGPGDRARRSKFRERLVQAGYHDPRAVTTFLGAKVVFALIGFTVYPVYGLLIARVLPNMGLVSMLLGLLGFLLPDILLRQRLRQRQREIVEALPDVLDLLMVCVEAGMGFDAAVARIASMERSGASPLHQELMRMHLEVRAGRPREEAMRDFGERTGSAEVKRVVTAFTQAERLGTPLGRTLRVHAEAARVDRRHRAEAKAYAAPLKMIFPTAIFLMPAFMLIAMAPALLTLIKMMQSLGGGGR